MYKVCRGPLIQIANAGAPSSELVANLVAVHVLQATPVLHVLIPHPNILRLPIAFLMQLIASQVPQLIRPQSSLSSRL